MNQAWLSNNDCLNTKFYFQDEGIHYQTTIAQTPKWNGVVKRQNRTLVEATQIVLSAANLPLFFWVEVIATACYTQNCSLIIPRHEKTPYHIINDRKPTLKFLHIFGCTCYIVRDGENLDKMKKKGDPYTTDTSLQELELLFSPMFKKYLNGGNQGVSKSSALFDTSQKKKDTSLRLNVQPTLVPLTPTTNVNAEENNNDQAVDAQINKAEFMNPFATPVTEVAESPSCNIDSPKKKEIQFLGQNLEDSSAAGTDNRPPMLEESDYESWKIRIERYIKGKTHGKLIWKSILNGPSTHPQITDPVPTSSPAGTVMQPRDKRDKEFTDAENLKELCDIQASNILSQWLPRRIFNTLNQTQSAKEIWESLELLMQGSGQTLDRKKEDLFDKYERFHANGNELIQDYFVRFHKLINDMKVTKLTIPTHQMNTKFVNNLPSYWSKYVTSVKNIKNLLTDSYIDLYTHLRSYEEHALKKLKKQEQSSSVVDPLAYLVKTTHQRAPTHFTTTSPSQLTPALASTSSSIALSHDDAISGHHPTQGLMLRCMMDKSLLNRFRDELRCKEPKHLKDSLWHQDKVMLLQEKENGAVLDAEAEAFLADVECTVPLAEPLALTTTNMFQVNHQDAYDSDVDDKPNAAAAFMANLSSSSSQINKVRTFNDNIFETVSPSWPSEYLATKESQDVPTEASPIPPTAAYMLQTLTDLTTQVEGHRKIIHYTMMSDEPNAAASFMANLSSSSSQINEVRTFHDNIFETVSPSWPSEVPQDEHLDSDDDSVQEDYMIPYDQYLATKESQDVPTKASPIPPTAAYMLQTLTDLTTQVEGHRKVNQEQALVNATLSAELNQCKLELARLKRNKVKLECDHVLLPVTKEMPNLSKKLSCFRPPLGIKRRPLLA
nr:retrovirus-related Pol polyprotein from transposon TNT 1-94 [Tanacetum cinerariifolium]